jgi:FkbM family methyltransferase
MKLLPIKSVMKIDRAWIPLPKFLPFETFPHRFLKKLTLIISNLLRNLGAIFGIIGARKIGKSINGNVLLRLNKSYPLGNKGFVLELPRDRTIYNHVKRYGFWEINESTFLALGLKTAENKSDSKIAFLDIGANTGLVTLQVINHSNSESDFFLFEPIPKHVGAIRHNLGSMPNVQINEFALSNLNGSAFIYTDNYNKGNSSLFKAVVPEGKHIKTLIELIDADEWCKSNLKRYTGFVVKSDTQGMDALILSRISEKIWNAVECAIIEVWALPEINSLSVVNLLDKFQDFSYVSWDPFSGQLVSIEEIRDFWLSKNGNSRNLYLSKVAPVI